MSMLPEALIEPKIDSDSREWWEGVRRHELLLPYCNACGTTFFPPMPTCPACGTVAPILRRATGTGIVYSWVVVHRALDPAFSAEVPYTILAVDLDEGARMFGRLRGDLQTVQAGDRVRAVFYQVGHQDLVGFELFRAG